MTTPSAEAMEKARSVDKDFHFEGRSVLPHEIIVSIAAALDAFAAEALAVQGVRHWTAIQEAVHKARTEMRIAMQAQYPKVVDEARADQKERDAKIAENAFGGPAHTYASENSDLYRGQDQACRRIAAAIRKQP